MLHILDSQDRRAVMDWTWQKGITISSSDGVETRQYYADGATDILVRDTQTGQYIEWKREISLETHEWLLSDERLGIGED